MVTKGPRLTGTGAWVFHCDIQHINPLTHPLHATDSGNFFSSAFFEDADPKSGLGGWGDPTNDYQVPDGGFSDFRISYPAPHTLRRNFTLQPYLGALASMSPFFLDPRKYANTSFTPEEVSKLVNGFVGDFKSFQAYFEAFEVSQSGFTYRPFVAYVSVDRRLTIRCRAHMGLCMR